MRQTAVRLLCCLFYIVLATGIFNAPTPEPATERFAFYATHYFAPWAIWLAVCEPVYRLRNRRRIEDRNAPHPRYHTF